ncbi:uncharacterized protein I206_101745 [Kwoniella pini CBS 10737]|uniref:Major facilitator superfamily (MFS) profile domain-containing protein n=1 Tax=Kwoniella pini CBS 10737 TaxID=1296096 RepID=A0A1B9HVU9_9TREE|nr:uncharacterized protein I206_06285 [Kwoniella pini CBS 10737]OCF47389.1 hypothetical protein I206_06285 [Kwoniella pini CBS 10737]
MSFSRRVDSGETLYNGLDHQNQDKEPKEPKDRYHIEPLSDLANHFERRKDKTGEAIMEKETATRKTENALGSLEIATDPESFNSASTSSFSVPTANTTSFHSFPPEEYRNDQQVNNEFPSSKAVENQDQGQSKNYIQSRSVPFQVIFVIITCATQLLAQGQFGMVLITLNDLGLWLGTEDAGQLSWMAAGYGLTLGIFVVVSGRLGDMFGPKLIWSIGCIFGIASNVGSGFCKSPIPFDICRAIAGLGSALSLPNALAILGRTYPPGKVRNIVFAILGALAPAGFIVGGAIASIFCVLLNPKWIWWSTAIFIFIFLICGLFILPSDENISSNIIRKKIKSFDYGGTILLIFSMGLFNFVWNQSSLIGWEKQYIYILLILSILSFISFIFFEKNLGKKALIPIEVLSNQSLLVYLTLWLGWMSFGTFLLYSTFFIHNIREYHNSLLIRAQLSPLMPGGIVAALLVPFLIHRFSGNHIFLISMISFFIGNLFAALTPKDQTYWGLTFFSLIICVFGPDLSFSTGQLIVSNSVNHEFQGIAAGIVSMITNYSLSIGLGMAGTVERYIKGSGKTQNDLLKGYRAAFWLATGLSGLAIIVVALFVRTPKQTHGHEDEKIAEKQIEEGRLGNSG